MQRATATPDLTPEEEAAVREWFVERVPDFLWPSYPFDAPPGRALSSINMVGKANGDECLNRLDEVRVYAYNGNAADNFQIYHTNPAVLPRPPASPAPTTRPYITGLTTPISALVVPGQITSPVAGSTLTSTTQLFEWSAGIGTGTSSGSIS